MILGHWYLVIPSMQVSLLQSVVKLHIVSMVIRVAVVAAVVFMAIATAQRRDSRLQAVASAAAGLGDTEENAVYLDVGQLRATTGDVGTHTPDPGTEVKGLVVWARFQPGRSLHANRPRSIDGRGPYHALRQRRIRTTPAQHRQQSTQRHGPFQFGHSRISSGDPVLEG